MDELFNFDPLFNRFDEVLKGFWATIRLSVAAGVLSLILGTIMVSFRVSPIPVLRAVGTFYVNTLRNIPLTLVLLMCSLGISDTLHLAFSDTPTINYYWWGVIGLAAYTGTFVCEALRSGINTVPLGQAEAARSIGLTFTESLRMIILPQAYRAVIAPLGSVYIAMIKNTSVVVAAGYAEAAGIMKLIFDQEGASLGVFIGFAIGYMILTLPTGFFFGWLAKRAAVAR